MSQGYPKSPEIGNTADTANLAIDGKINSTGIITLTLSSATTVLTNYFLGPESVVLFDPMDALAAAELYGGTMYVLEANRGTGAWTITNANNAGTRKFSFVILG